MWTVRMFVGTGLRNALLKDLPTLWFVGNTMSNLIMIVPPLYGALQTLKDGLETRYVFAFLGLAGEFESL